MTTAKKVIVKKTVVKKMVAKNAGANQVIPSANKRTIHKVNTEQIQDIFIDGMSNLVAGPATAKISFYSTISASETEETRRMEVRLVMTTDVMIDIVEKLRSSIMKNEEKLKNGLDSHKIKTLGLVDKLKS